MNLLTISSFAGLTGAAAGGALIGRGYEDYKKDKTSGIAKMIFGASVIGIGCAVIIYNTFTPLRTQISNEAISIVCTDDARWDENCDQVVDFVNNFIKNGSLTAYNNITNEKKDITFKLAEMFSPENTVCIGENFNLFCNVSMKNISLLNGTISGETILNQNDQSNLQSLSASKTLKLMFIQGQENGLIETTVNYVKSFF